MLVGELVTLMSHEILFFGFCLFRMDAALGELWKHDFWNDRNFLHLNNIERKKSQLRKKYFFRRWKSLRFFLLEKNQWKSLKSHKGIPIHTVERAKITLFRTCQTSLPVYKTCLPGPDGPGSIINQKFSFTWNKCLSIKTYIHFAYNSPIYSIFSTFFSKIRCFTMYTVIFCTILAFTRYFTFTKSKFNNLLCIFCKSDSNEF